MLDNLPGAENLKARIPSQTHERWKSPLPLFLGVASFDDFDPLTAEPGLRGECEIHIERTKGGHARLGIAEEMGHRPAYGMGFAPAMSE